MKLTIENVITQWIKENTRFRGDEELSRLTLIFTIELDIVEDIACKSPIGMSDHVVIEF